MGRKHSARHSIRTQFALIFSASIIGVILIFWAINTLFLQSYYMREQQGKIILAYERMDTLSQAEDLGSELFQRGFYQLCHSGDLNAAIATPSLGTVLSSAADDEVLVWRLLDHVFGVDFNPALMEKAISDNRSRRKGRTPTDDESEGKTMEPSILVEAEHYQVLTSRDPRLGLDFMELWGTLSNGNYIILRTGLENIRESSQVSNQFLGIVGFFMAIICGIIIWFVSSKITRPIKELAEISHRMTHLDFNAKYTRGGKNEIAELGSHINELSSTLESTISELKTANNELKRDIENKDKQDSMRLEFLSNVAHELKTPIALIQGYAEGLQDNVNEDEESRNFYCEVIVDEARKMNQLVQSLTTLNQLEFGVNEIQFSRFDIVELIQGCIQANDILIRQEGIQVDFRETEAVYVWSDEFKAEEVITNYLSNAIHYCGEAAVAGESGGRKGSGTEVGVGSAVAGESGGQEGSGHEAGQSAVAGESGGQEGSVSNNYAEFFTTGEGKELQPEKSRQGKLDKAPAVTEEPVSDKAPAVTEEPVSDKSPSVTEESSVSDKAPSVTEGPVSDKAPAVTEEPVSDKAPAVTEEPVSDKAPAVTESSASGQVPVGKWIVIRLHKGESRVRISVFNTGNPIPEDSISHLWDKFYKVDKARSREYGGSGIGLSIVKAIMESLNQKFGVSNYSNGVEFWFELDSTGGSNEVADENPS
ncbi:MAG: HAMP domain-containing protein [Lachnospiraceae bacterium]|nr:HAMP domain-containing protein [Lachnospiraceae bacterium]